MATTTNYGWTTPDDTALVKDGAAAIRSLGSSIDTTLKAQIDAQIPDSIIDAKGDLIVGTADNTPARLAVGSNNQVLTADSTTASGVKWAAVAATPPQLITQNSTFYIKSGSGAPGSTTSVNNRTYYQPIYLDGKTTVDRISMRTGSTFSGSISIRLGIYNVSSTTGFPTTVFLDAGTVTATAASTQYDITISQIPAAGYYYLASNIITAVTTQTFTSIGTASPFFAGYLAASMNGTNEYSYFTENVTASSSFATAGTLTFARTADVAVGLRIQ